MCSTINHTYLEAELGDSRLTDRFNIILSQLSRGLNTTLPKAAQKKAATKAIYRFLDNSKVSSNKLLDAHFQGLNLMENDSSPGRILCLSDTVELDYTNKRIGQDLGPLTFRTRRGMLVHNSLLTKEDGTPLGVLDQQYIIRKDENFGKYSERKRLPYEQKEGYKWYKAFNTAQQVCEQSDLEIVFVADRESDIIQVFHARKHPKMHFVIRSQYDRRTTQQAKLHEQLSQQSQIGTYNIQVTNPKNGKERTAQLAVRFCSAELKRSGSMTMHKQIRPIEVNAIETYELNPPVDVDQPIRWVLLTSLPVTNFDTALQVIHYYIRRWIVERFHFLLKSGGAQIENLQLAKINRLKNAIALYSIALMDAMKIRYLAQNNPDQNIYDAGVSELEHKVLYVYAQQNIDSKICFDPENPPSIFDYSRVLGQITGFIPSKRQPIPGLKILTRSIERLHVLKDAYLAFNQQKE